MFTAQGTHQRPEVIAEATGHPAKAIAAGEIAQGLQRVQQEAPCQIAESNENFHMENRTRPNRLALAQTWVWPMRCSAKKAVASLMSLVLPLAVVLAADTDVPNEQLPNRVRPSPNSVTLYADYSTKSANGIVPVYLVNAGTNTINLEAQDGDVFLKLEVRNPQGRWVRAQPHAYSWCGNSYFTRQVRPDHFLLINGYQPTNGQPRRVRFSLYQQEFALSSNVGDGVAAIGDIDLASRDAMAVYEGTFEFVSSVALGEIQLTNELDHIKDLQASAIRTLASPRFDPRKSRNVLSEVLKKFPNRDEDVASVIAALDTRSESDGATNRTLTPARTGR